MRFPFTIAFSASSLRYHCEFPDVPEMSQYEFDTKEEVGALGRDKLLYTLEYAYRRQGRVIPLPSAVGEDYYFYVLLPYQAKILLWNRLLETGGNASQLARDFGCSRQELQCILDLTKPIGLEKIEKVLFVLDRSFKLSCVKLP